MPEDAWEIWLYGVIAPLPITGIALLWIISRHADLHSRNGLILQGTDAVALGITALFLALALHFRFFWGLSGKPTLKRFSLVGKALSVVGAMAGLLYLTWRMVCLIIS